MIKSITAYIAVAIFALFGTFNFVTAQSGDDSGSMGDAPRSEVGSDVETDTDDNDDDSDMDDDMDDMDTMNTDNMNAQSTTPSPQVVAPAVLPNTGASL